MILMIVGFVCLCQPWSEVLHAYSVTITLIGLIVHDLSPARAWSPHSDSDRSCCMAHIVLQDIEKYFGSSTVIRKV